MRQSASSGNLMHLNVSVILKLYCEVYPNLQSQTHWLTDPLSDTSYYWWRYDTDGECDSTLWIWLSLTDSESVTHDSDTPTDSDIIFIQLSIDFINNLIIYSLWWLIVMLSY